LMVIAPVPWGSSTPSVAVDCPRSWDSSSSDEVAPTPLRRPRAPIGHAPRRACGRGSSPPQGQRILSC
jgi:hypothetical protein